MPLIYKILFGISILAFSISTLHVMNSEINYIVMNIDIAKFLMIASATMFVLVLIDFWLNCKNN